MERHNLKGSGHLRLSLFINHLIGRPGGSVVTFSPQVSFPRCVLAGEGKKRFNSTSAVLASSLLIQ
jgi:hypothetical protein